MHSRYQALQHLLAGELPLDKVGPQLRDAAARALASRDEQRMLATARSAAGELMRRGELLRVAIETAGDGAEKPQGPFCLLRGTQRLVDLSVLGGEPLRFPAYRRREAVADDVPDRSFDGLTGMLGAMEEAQDLDLGAPQSGDAGVILSGVLRLLARFTPQFRIFAQVGDSITLPPERHEIFRVDREQMRLGWQGARPAGHSVWIPAVEELPEHVRRALAGEEEGFTCAAGVPLWEPAQPGGNEARHEVGLLFVAATEDWGRDAMLRLAERLSRFVTRRWQNQRDVNQRIHRDGLTGAFNRAYFDSQFPLELERARRSQVPLTLVMADLDHFKRINDDYGHQAGDRILIMLVRRLQEELRRIDHVCRVGGEEFALILPDTSSEAAQDVVSRLLAAEYSETTVPDRESSRLHVTASFGAATFPAAGADPFELYRKADAMLYLSKDLGRNQCHFWSSQGDHFRLLPPAADG